MTRQKGIYNNTSTSFCGNTSIKALEKERPTLQTSTSPHAKMYIAPMTRPSKATLICSVTPPLVIMATSSVGFGQNLSAGLVLEVCADRREDCLTGSMAWLDLVPFSHQPPCFIDIADSDDCDAAGEGSALGPL